MTEPIKVKTTRAERDKAPRHLSKMMRAYWALGYKAAKEGKPAESCPYGADLVTDNRKKRWLEGWQAAQNELALENAEIKCANGLK